MFIYVILSIHIYFRQSNNEDKKEKMILQRKMELENTIHDLQFNLERHDAQIRELTRTIADLGKLFCLFYYL